MVFLSGLSKVGFVENYGKNKSNFYGGLKEPLDLISDMKQLLLLKALGKFHKNAFFFQV